MTTIFFGPRWDAPIMDAAEQTATPVGKRCLVCKEPIVDGDRGLIGAMAVASDTEPGQLVSRRYAVHTECEMLGISGHVFGVCSCTGFDTSSRASALELLARINADRASAGMGPL